MSTGTRGRTAFVVLLVAAMAGLVVAPARADEWRDGPGMGVARYAAATVMLPDGRVLAIGGTDDGLTELDSVEAYDPTARSWSTRASMGLGRQAPHATVLGDGNVLVVSDKTGEVYDPVADAWTPVANQMRDPRGGDDLVASGGITLLRDGRVLLAGSDSAPTRHVDLYDPATNSFTDAADMGTAREFPGQALLPDGRVLVAGGYDVSGALASAEIYDPATDHWSPVANTMASGHVGPIMQPLPDGRVLVVGGLVALPGATPNAQAEVYDPATNRFSPTGPVPTPRIWSMATTLSDGRVLVAGGVGAAPAPGAATDVAEIYHPATGTWSAAGPLTTAVAWPVASTLGDGTVLVAGGTANAPGGGRVASRDTQIYTPSTVPGAPTGVLAFPGNGSATVAWSRPAVDGGATVTGYLVRSSTGASVAVPADRTSATVTGLANGTPVTFTVTAGNAVGSGAASAPSAAVTPSAPVGPVPLAAPDRTAPALGVRGVHKKMRLRTFRKGVRPTVSTNEPSLVTVVLLGRVRTAKLFRTAGTARDRAPAARRYNLTLATRSFHLDGKRRVRLRASRALLGKAHRFRVRVRVVAVDDAGNRSTRTRTIRVRR